MDWNDQDVLERTFVEIGKSISCALQVWENRKVSSCNFENQVPIDPLVVTTRVQSAFGRCGPVGHSSIIVGFSGYKIEDNY